MKPVIEGSLPKLTAAQRWAIAKIIDMLERSKKDYIVDQTVLNQAKYLYHSMNWFMYNRVPGLVTIPGQPLPFILSHRYSSEAGTCWMEFREVKPLAEWTEEEGGRTHRYGDLFSFRGKPIEEAERPANIWRGVEVDVDNKETYVTTGRELVVVGLDPDLLRGQVVIQRSLL